jgi:protein transport protein SEC61 subunit gamma and related proteins
MENPEKVTAGTKLKSFISQCARVWHLLKKPDKEEFQTIAKVSAIGLGIIGAMGFLISTALVFLHL